MWRHVVICAVLATGCSTHANRLQEVREAYFAGDMKTARAKIDEGVKKYPGEADVLKLDRATILLTEGKVRDAEQILRNARDHFDYLEQKNAGYAAVPVGAYVHAALREERSEYADAARSLQLVCNWAPDFTAGKKDLQRVETGHHSQKGHGVVYVFTLVGQGPYKEERAEVPT